LPGTAPSLAGGNPFPSLFEASDELATDETQESKGKPPTTTGKHHLGRIAR
jgi:hypothetical protein